MMPRQKFTPLDRLVIAAVYVLVVAVFGAIVTVTALVQGMPS